ncbi:TlyA rRNA methyltransferase/hemolysin family protein [Anoxybacillus sp. B7M1]|jgi:23S rRNA (cytidine1920-2'-O)/16S rRNA (cytidine1409-2'-O)-methyltransferase|uniref:TlyA family RNA methyltransferase n=1 Tax=Anoxybacteroides rupiense TaxID=311460 RepID=A0ABD5IR75_9BACL|nr:MULTISPECIES: TlyA family RNA methyltransferase [Anoxybacillus]ANB57300.1 TlyA rRNA methyltransferase/hemolysin family protein [Anoxybacillus sp. B2M1]ANB65134.1 TlyA rRNA methyltransferase/hemolysin family protein [Anoxybacillus sp. B7M1]KXG11214.1 Hemolysin A [Anoxybacillus sp. P3H1B]MBB3906792.1 23S rRNA (cytidine1920-2'-O)/16S rRNA (cytidine1409-2'-O)-methyltransferase [Anoxybacillus rupiensis]MBS2770097.1 TlyA family RNA methyltransferase [Anoxybacillus rupiensis]
MKGKKERVDVLLVERGLMETREKAKRAIMAGLVYSNEMRLDKPGEKVPADIPLTVKGNALPYVSRGGLKLEKALRLFDVSVKDKILLDIGASTGGFTDCALQNGAKMSYALDVGYNQLAWKLRQDERVVVMERTNFRYVTPAHFTKGLPEIATIDVSFISLKLILPVLKTVLVPESDVIALVKPQFEAGKEHVGKKGIVRDPSIHELVLVSIIDFALSEGYDALDLSYSPITGGDGNIEFLLHLRWEGEQEAGKNKLSKRPADIVKQAHSELKAGAEERE